MKYNLILFIVFTVSLTSCLQKNRLKITKVNGALVSIDNISKENGCYVYNNYNGEGITALAIWFEIEFVADGTKKRNVFSSGLTQGCDGPTNKVESFNISLIDEIGNKNQINDFLINDSSYFLYKRNYNYFSEGESFGSGAVKTDCDNKNLYNCYCSSQYIYLSLEEFIFSFNTKSLQIICEELKAPFHFIINTNKINPISTYKNLEFEIKFDDETTLINKIQMDG